MMNEKIKTLVVATALFSPMLSVAQEPRFQLGLGAGAPYGLLGVQAAVSGESVRGYVAAGMYNAMTIGFELAVDSDNKHAIGLNYIQFDSPLLFDLFQTDIEYTQTALTYTYHASGLSQSGWTVGVTLGELTESSEFMQEDDSTTNVGFHVGYKFSDF